MPLNPDVAHTLSRLKQRLTTPHITAEDKVIVEGFITQIEANPTEANQLELIKDSWFSTHDNAYTLDHRLIRAAKNGSINDIKVFKALGANVEAKSIGKVFSSRKTALQKAIKHHQYDAIVMLKQLGVDINAKDDHSGNTPLMMAAQAGDLKAIEVLIECGADLHAKNKNGINALELAKDTATYVLLDELLLKNGALSQPLPTFTEKDFIQLLYPHTHAPNQHFTVADAFWEMISNNQQYSIGTIWNDVSSKPLRYAPYPAKSVIPIAILTSIKTAFIAQCCHALGTLEHFKWDPRYHYGTYVDAVFLNFKKYETTLYNLHKHTGPETILNSGYYNTPFQESLIDSLKKFITQQPAEEDKNALENALSAMEASTAYYNTFFSEKLFPTEQITTDLDKGKMRMFSVGRKVDFHAINIIIKENYLIIADRFDTRETKSFSETQKIIQHSLSTQTGRHKEAGIFVYDLKKSFSELTETQKKQLLTWFKGEMSQEESIFGIKKLLDIDQPIAILLAKPQTKGSCRYASKKAGVGGLIFLSLLAQRPDNIQEVIEHACSLQKQFTEFDRLNKINDIMHSTLLRQEEQEQLLFLVLFRNNNPDNLTDGKICKKILDYYKTSQSAIEVLLSLVTQLELKVNDIQYSPVKYEALRAFGKLITQLKNNGLDYGMVEQGTTKNIHYKT